MRTRKPKEELGGKKILPFIFYLDTLTKAESLN